MESQHKLEEQFDNLAPHWDSWIKRNNYYHVLLKSRIREIIPSGSTILEIGCATGDLLASLEPKIGVGIDFSSKMLDIARIKYPRLNFIKQDAQNLFLEEKFDYVILSDLIGCLDDIYEVLKRVSSVCKPETVIIINSYNFLWEGILKIGETFGMRMHQGYQNWLSSQDITNMLYLTGFEVTSNNQMILFPKKIPLISNLMNKYVGHWPIIRNFNLVNFITAKKSGSYKVNQNYSCTVLVPCRNEAGNIKDAILRIPEMGSHTEIIVVDGNSTDGTVEITESIIKEYKGLKDIKLLHQVDKNSPNFNRQTGSISGNKMLKLGKGDAVRKGFDMASGDILMILDSDLCVMPEDLPKFFEILASKKADFVNGSRLVYRPESGAMNGIRFLGNRTFSKIFSFLINQYITDTLCGTKALFKNDYERMKEYRQLFGDFDPFGDFELLFTASKANLKIVDLPVWYQRRLSGTSKVSVIKHGILLIKMCFIAFLRFKMPFIKDKYVNEGLRKKMEQQHGENIASNAENVWGWSTPAGMKRIERRVEEITSRMHGKKHILELGCGTGVFSEQLAKKGFNPVSIDISSHLIKIGKNNQPKINFIAADAEKLPIASNSIDCVMGVSVLHHLNCNTTLQEIKRVLKKDGIIVFSEPNMANPQILIQKNVGFIKKIAGDTPTETAFLRWSMKKLLKKHGFHQIEIKPFDFMHPAIPGILINSFRPIGEILERMPVIKEIAGSLIISAKK